MMVSTKGRYALRVMLDLAEYGHGGTFLSRIFPLVRKFP